MQHIDELPASPVVQGHIVPLSADEISNDLWGESELQQQQHVWPFTDRQNAPDNFRIFSGEQQQQQQHNVQQSHQPTTANLGAGIGFPNRVGDDESPRGIELTTTKTGPARSLDRNNNNGDFEAFPIESGLQAHTFHESFWDRLRDPENKKYLILAAFMLFCAVVLAIVLPSTLVHPKPPVRNYYLAIQEVEWNYGGQTDLCRAPNYRIDTTPWTANSPQAIGSIYRKARFVAYTDDSFVHQAPNVDQMGLMGPVIRGETGDEIRITIINYGSFPYSLNVAGIYADKADEGAMYNDQEPNGWPRYAHDDDVLEPSLNSINVKTGFGMGYHVEPGTKFTYVWRAVEQSAPSANDASSLVYIYRSYSIDRSGIDAGLFGPVVITKKGMKKTDDNLMPTDVDIEAFAFFSTIDENNSPYIHTNIRNKIDSVYRPAAPYNTVALYGLDKVKLLQALYSHANSNNGGAADSIDYDTAASVINAANAAKSRVGNVKGTPINIWLSPNLVLLDPAGYDALYGKGSVQKIVNALLPPLVDTNSASFKDSNIKHSVNGFLFCNNAAPAFTVGQRVRWYVAALGPEAIRPKIFGLPTVKDSNLSLYPGATTTIDIVPTMPGVYEFGSAIASQGRAGQSMLFNVTGDPINLSVNSNFSYSLIAQEIEWSYLHNLNGNNNNINPCTNQPFTAAESEHVTPSPTRIGASYRKAIFMSQTLPNYGLLGPVLRASVGSTIKITVTNNVSFPISLDIPDLILTNPSTRTVIGDITVVLPAQTKTFEFYVPAILDDMSNAASASSWSKVVSYRSRATPDDVNAGLIGSLVLYSTSTQANAGKVLGVDTELFAAIGSFDENHSPLFPVNSARIATPSSALVNSPDFVASNMMGSVNGYSYCTSPKSLLALNSNVRMYIVGLGGNLNGDGDAVAISPLSVSIENQHKQVFRVLQGDAVTVDFVSPAFTSNVSVISQYLDRVSGGEIVNLATVAALGVAAPTLYPTFTAVDRTYYISADEFEWDYAPSGSDQCYGKDFEVSQKSVFKGPDRIGTKYIKAIYREYSSDQFTHLRQGIESRDNTLSQHLGILGPVIRAEVGDVIQIVFRNNVGFRTSFSIQGFPSLGYADPGQVKVYTWIVPEAAGPGDNDENSVALVYTSDVDSVAHYHAGLFGVFLITRKGDGTGKDAAPARAGKEFVAAFAVIDENLSPYITQNIARYLPASTDPSLLQDPDFIESNQMYSINGFVYCNGKLWQTRQDEGTRFYFVSLGSASQSAAMLGHTFNHLQHNAYAAQVASGETQTVDMGGINPGSWFLWSEFADHAYKGQLEMFTVSRRIFG